MPTVGNRHLWQPGTRDERIILKAGRNKHTFNAPHLLLLVTSNLTASLQTKPPALHQNNSRSHRRALTFDYDNVWQSGCRVGELPRAGQGASWYVPSAVGSPSHTCVVQNPSASTHPREMPEQPTPHSRTAVRPAPKPKPLTYECPEPKPPSTEAYKISVGLGASKAKHKYPLWLRLSSGSRPIFCCGCGFVFYM